MTADDQGGVGFGEENSNAALIFKNADGSKYMTLEVKINKGEAQFKEELPENWNTKFEEELPENWETFKETIEYNFPMLLAIRQNLL